MQKIPKEISKGIGESMNKIICPICGDGEIFKKYGCCHSEIKEGIALLDKKDERVTELEEELYNKNEDLCNEMLNSKLLKNRIAQLEKNYTSPEIVKELMSKINELEEEVLYKFDCENCHHAEIKIKELEEENKRSRYKVEYFGNLLYKEEY